VYVYVPLAGDISQVTLDIIVDQFFHLWRQQKRARAFGRII